MKFLDVDGEEIPGLRQSLFSAVQENGEISFADFCVSNLFDHYVWAPHIKQLKSVKNRELLLKKLVRLELEMALSKLKLETSEVNI